MVVRKYRTPNINRVIAKQTHITAIIFTICYVVLMIMEKITSKINVKDGDYDANWGGWVLTINSEQFKTIEGIRTPNLPIKCKVINGEAYFVERR